MWYWQIDNWRALTIKRSILTETSPQPCTCSSHPFYCRLIYHIFDLQKRFHRIESPTAQSIDLYIWWVLGKRTFFNFPTNCPFLSFLVNIACFWHASIRLNRPCPVSIWAVPSPERAHTFVAHHSSPSSHLPIPPLYGRRLCRNLQLSLNECFRSRWLSKRKRTSPTKIL